MAATKFNRGEILEVLAGKMKAVSDNVFVTSRPTAIQERMNDFVVVELPLGITHRADTYQDGYVRFNLYARDKANGIENTTKLDAMVDAVMAQAPIAEKGFSLLDPRLLASGSDKLGFHAVAIQAKIIINI